MTKVVGDVRVRQDAPFPEAPGTGSDSIAKMAAVSRIPERARSGVTGAGRPAGERCADRSGAVRARRQEPAP